MVHEPTIGLENLELLRYLQRTAFHTRCKYALEIKTIYGDRSQSFHEKASEEIVFIRIRAEATILSTARV